MTRRKVMIAAGVILVMLAITIGVVRQSGSSDEITVAKLAQQTHFHGIAVDPKDSARLLLATHHGLYAVPLDGSAERISETTDDYMGFMPHPADPEIMYASGHPAGGGNLGFVESRDGGQSWTQLSPGAAGIADFHSLTVSPAEPKILYGAHAGVLQMSRDGGATWGTIGPAPEGLLDLAASAKSPEELLAGTKRGLFRSTDGGKSWIPAYGSTNPVPLVQVTPQGTGFAFVIGTGLLRTEEPDLAWSSTRAMLGGRYILHLAVDPSDERKLYAITLDRATEAQEILASTDAGETWIPLGSISTSG